MTVIKKIIKYLNSLIIYGSLAIWFLPLILVEDNQWSLLHTVKTTMGFYDNVGRSGLICGTFRLCFFDIAVGVLIFAGILLLEFLLSGLLPDIASYIIGLIGSIVNLTAGVLFIWFGGTRLGIAENSLGDIGITAQLGIEYSTVFIFAGVYAAVFLFSLAGILIWTKSRNVSKSDLIQETEELPDLQYEEEADYGQTEDNRIYPDDCFENRWLELTEQGVVLKAGRGPDPDAAISYSVETGTYMLKPLKKTRVYLKSGQPLGKERIYSLPGGTEVYIRDLENLFILS